MKKFIAVPTQELSEIVQKRALFVLGYIWCGGRESSVSVEPTRVFGIEACIVFTDDGRISYSSIGEYCKNSECEINFRDLWKMEPVKKKPTKITIDNGGTYDLPISLAKAILLGIVQ